MKQRKQLLNSLGLSSPHLSQHLLRLLLLLVTAIGGVGSSWADEVLQATFPGDNTGYTCNGTTTTASGSGYTLNGQTVYAVAKNNSLQVTVPSTITVTKVEVLGTTSESGGNSDITVSNDQDESTTGGFNKRDGTISTIEFTPTQKSSTIRIANGNTRAIWIQYIKIYTSASTPTFYTVTFNPGAGTISGSSSITQETEGSPITTPSATPNDPENYVFLGWYKSAAFGATRAAQGNSSYTPTSNETLYAQYRGKKTVENLTQINSNYTFTPSEGMQDQCLYEDGKILSLGANSFRANSLQIKSNRKIAFKVAENAKVTITYTTNNSVKLQLGSSEDADAYGATDNGTLTATIPSAAILYVSTDGNDIYITQLKISYGETYTVTYSNDATKGNCTTESFTQTEEGQSTILPGATPKPGYTFHGWDTNGDGTADVHTGDNYTPTQDITLTAVYSNSNTVGDANEGWWSAFSNFVTLPKDNSIHLTFTNVSYGEEYWRNWLMIVTNNDKGHNGDGEQTTADNELYMLRPDYFASKGDHEYSFYKDDNGQYRPAYLSTNDEKSAFKAAMAKATVDVQVSFDGNNVYTIAKINGANGTKYVLVDKSTNSFNGPLDNVYVSFMADKSTLTFTAQNDATPSVKVNVSANNPEYTTGYVAKIASGIRLDNNRPIWAGTNVEFQATPKTGYTLVNWTDEASNVISTEEGFSKEITADANYTANFAANYAYTVTSKCGDIVFDTKNGTGVANTQVSVPYKQYYLHEETLYTKSAQSNEFNQKFTLDTDNKNVDINYTKTSIDNVVFLKEAEEISGMTASTANNAGVRLSNSLGGQSSSEVVITTLPVGKYKIFAQVRANDNTFNIKAGSEDIWSLTVSGGNNSKTSDEFVITSANTNIIASSATGNNLWDYFYIVRTGDAVTYNVTQAASTGGSIKSSVSLTQPVPAGTNITFTATANDWYQVENWYDEATNPATKLADAVNTCDVTVNADMNVKVNFIRYYNVAVTTAGGGTVALKNEAKTEDVAADAKLKKDTKVTAIATAAPGYHFVKWEANGVEVPSAQAEYTKKVNEFVNANATLITLNAVFEEDAVAVAVPTADPASGYTIHLGDKITLSAEEGATISYIWASASGLYTTVADMQAETDRLKSSESNTIQVSTNTVGPRYLYAYAQKGNWTSDVVCFNYTAQLIAGEATVLEVRGTKHTGDAPYYFTNSKNTTTTAFTGNQEFSDGSQISPISADQSSLAFRGSANKVNINSKDHYKVDIILNTTSASKIIVGARGGGDAARTISKVQVNGEDVTFSTSGTCNKTTISRLEITGLNVKQGDEVSVMFSGTTNVYYFEVYSTSLINAPKIKDNGDKSATITSKTDGTTIYYKTYAEKPASIPSKDELTSTLTGGKTAKVDVTSYVYAYAKKDDKYSDITEGIINVATTPSLSCTPVAVTLSINDNNLPNTQQITTVASMNKEVVTSNYTYSYTSDKTSVATVNGTGLITAVGAGSAKITITAKSSDEVVATDEVIVVVTDKDMITPVFTWNGTQFDVVVNNKFSDKTPKAYKEVELNSEQRFVDITTGYNITYFSSNDNATVNSSGVVTGVNVGKATITAVFIAKDDYAGSYNPGIATITANVKVGGAAPLNVEVSNNPPVIDLSTAALTYQSKAPTLVAAQYTTLNNSEWFATYESDNWNVATVDATGLVTAHNVGEAHIVVAYMPNQDGQYADDFNAFVHTYTVKVVDPTRFIITQGYGYDETTKHSTVFPLSTVTDNNKYVTMTFGGWRGVNGTDDTTYNSDKKRDEGTEYNGGRDYWGGSSDAGKTDAAGANPDYPYAITAKTSGNPTSESIANYNPNTANQFSVPCRGAYIMFEPSVDGTITANIIQNGVLDADDFTKTRSGRLVYIIDEFGKVVTPTAYGMASDVRNWKAKNSTTTGNKDKNSHELTEAEYLAATKALGLGDALPTEGTHAPGNVESVIAYNQGYAVLRKGPSFYTFNVKAGKKYYIFGNGTKNGFYGFKFVKSNSFSATDITIATEDGVSKVNDGNDMTMDAAISKYNNKPVVIKEYDRNFTAGIWTPLVLPYSMNDIQVKSIFGDDVEILYVDDVQGSTIKMSHHFYKTIVAGKSCLIKPSKAVMSLATSNIEKDGVKYPYVTFSNVDITGYSDYTTGKEGAGYIWSASYEPQNVNGGDYYISTKDGNFTRLAAGKTAKLKGCRAFLKVVDTTLAKALTVDINGFEDDEEAGATGIIGVIVDEEGSMDVVMKNDKIYDLSGRAINSESMIKGNIYIHNGKKFIAQ